MALAVAADDSDFLGRAGTQKPHADREVGRSGHTRTRTPDNPPLSDVTTDIRADVTADVTVAHRAATGEPRLTPSRSRQ